MQMVVCKVKYCDFTLWTEKDLAIERISFDEAFFDHNLSAAKQFYVYGILSEVIGKVLHREACCQY